MIKYKEIFLEKIDNYELTRLRNKEPIVLYSLVFCSSCYTIPCPGKINGWYLHRDNGPAMVYKSILSGKNKWYWYGEKAKDESEWLNTNWRKQIEIKIFL